MNPLVKVKTDELPVTMKNGRMYVTVGALASVVAAAMAWAHAEAKTSDHERRLTKVEDALESAATKSDILRLERQNEQIIKVLTERR